MDILPKMQAGKPFSRLTISKILRNPIYAMADLDIYEFFKSQGTGIYNDAAWAGPVRHGMSGEQK